MKIGIFGGTFNPVHKGHIAVAKYAIEFLKLDKLIFLPAYQNPLRKTEAIVDPQHRLQMLQIACHVNNLKVEISPFEIKRQQASYTVDSVKYFRRQYPDAQIFWLIGGDNIKTLHKWRQIETIAQHVQLTIFKRNIHIKHLNIKKYHCLVLDNPLYPYASTDYKWGYLTMVDHEVQKYIGKNKLYLHDFLRNFTTPTRYKHSLATANLAVSYAQQNHVNSTKAYWGGLLHDLTKNWPLTKHHELLAKLNITHTDFDDHELHGLTASLWLEHFYLLDDAEITRAIKVHTTLDLHLSLLDKIVYAADKLCVGRKWNGIDKIRQSMSKNFAQGFSQLVQIIYTHLQNQQKTLTPQQQEIYHKWINHS